MILTSADERELEEWRKLPEPRILLVSRKTLERLVYLVRHPETASGKIKEEILADIESVIGKVE